ncbi:nucleoside hydrolase [Chitinispirillales bacterium ANBcel5]|uniref:nucleoside hydrolase n=1 Tax=Cellulosispirillum alkaliphilum TaxID=3039283 RepID=UPI002A54CA71|nr:nucleoside hydrolase [Chitinispirillales bacterium ANBcel5]
MKKTKVLLDTDIGSDLDDALALSYLLAEPRCELMGVTTVTGEPQKRAMLAHQLCSIANKDVPIYPGAATPMYGKQHQCDAPQAAALKNRTAKNFPDGKAIQFMRDTIRENPGEIVLLSIAPLTNIGLLFSIDPEIPRLLKGLVLMCGVFHYKLPELKNYQYEWNAIGDPFATSIVYNSPVTLHRSIGLDVTFKATMDLPKAQKRFTSKLLEPVLEFSKYYTDYPHITFHDPLAAMSIFHDDILEYEQGKVNLVQGHEGYEAMTRWSRDEEDSPHQVASEVDAPKFFDKYFSSF